MQMMREKWTDERLDDLKDLVVDGFRRTDERFVHLERAMTHWLIALVGIQITVLLAIVGGFVTVLSRL